MRCTAIIVVMGSVVAACSPKVPVPITQRDSAKVPVPITHRESAKASVPITQKDTGESARCPFDRARDRHRASRVDRPATGYARIQTMKAQAVRVRKSVT